MKRLMAAATIVAATLTTTAALAAAAEIAVEPVTIEVEGEAEFEITVTGFEPSVTVFVLPCAVPDDGEITSVDDVDATTCETNRVTSASTDEDGTATMTATWEVPAEGLVLVAGNEERSDAAFTLIDVGETVVLGTSQDDPVDETETETETETTAETTTELPATGSETIVLVLLGLGLIAAGGASRGLARRRALI